MHDPSSAGDKTAHLLSHTFTDATEDCVCGIIKGYIEANPKKIQELAGPWLKRKKTTVSDYVNFIIERGSKFDKLALMIFSIATKCHIGVIHNNNSMWTTNESGDIEECDVLFLNRGKLMFEAIESIEVLKLNMRTKKLKELLREKTQHIIPKKKKRIMRVEEMVRKRKGKVKKKRNLKKARRK